MATIQKASDILSTCREVCTLKAKNPTAVRTVAEYLSVFLS